MLSEAEATLHLQFARHLNGSSDAGWATIQGPGFHRWLPHGKEDAVRLASPEPTTAISVWFEQYGRMEGNMVIFDSKRREIDPTLIQNQGLLCGGPICGEALLAPVSANVLAALTSGTLELAEYEQLGKRVWRAVLKPVESFVELLRIRYGQYWLEVPRWDSRRMSLGHYCSLYNLKWSLDGTAWRDFIPNEPRINVELVCDMRMYEELVTTEDWSEIGKACAKEPKPSLAEFAAANAARLYHREEYTYAVVQACSSLELALDQCFRSHVSRSAADRLTKMPMKDQVAIAGGFMHIEPLLIERCANGVTLRNDIVHEGYRPDGPCRDETFAMLDMVRVLLSLPAVKRPSAHLRNNTATPDAWESGKFF